MTCSAVSCTSTDELHERIYAPYAVIKGPPIPDLRDHNLIRLSALCELPDLEARRPVVS
jgi:hypothetical protein